MKDWLFSNTQVIGEDITMKLAMIFINLCTIKSIQGCGADVKKKKFVLPGSTNKWKHWQLPPYNYDWWGFVNLLGTREVEEKTTVKVTLDSDSIEHEPGFPWKGVYGGDPGSEPPSGSAMKSYVGQPPSCLFPPGIGNGTESFKRWYYDPRAGVCKSFTYSGLGGNVNRFLTEYNCKEFCVRPPRVPCVPDKLFDYLSFLQTPDVDLM